MEVETETGPQVIRAEQVVIATGSTAATLPDLPFGGKVISSTEGLALRCRPGNWWWSAPAISGWSWGPRSPSWAPPCTVVEAQSRILPLDDAELTQPVAKRLRELGVAVLTGATVKGLSARVELQAAVATARPLHCRRTGSWSRSAAIRRPRAGGLRQSISTWTGGLSASTAMPYVDARRLRHRRRDGRAHAGASGLCAGRDGGGDRGGQKAKLG